MIISYSKSFIFVHIPKTGGTAMAAALDGLLGEEDIVIGDSERGRACKARLEGVKTAGRLWRHSALGDIDGLLSPEDITRFKVVTLVRNPWDRLVSYYSWLREQRFAHPAVERAKDTDFSGFLDNEQTQLSFKFWPYGAWLRQYESGEAPAQFIRLEQLSQDIIPFEEHLGTALNFNHLNISERQRDWRPYYTDADRQIVADICAEDIERFGYSFDDFDKRAD